MFSYLAIAAESPIAIAYKIQFFIIRSSPRLNSNPIANAFVVSFLIPRNCSSFTFHSLAAVRPDGDYRDFLCLHILCAHWCIQYILASLKQLELYKNFLKYDS